MSYYGQETIQVADGDYLDTLARMAAEARKRNDPTIAIALSLDMIGMLVDEVVRSRAREPLAAELVRLRAVEKAAREQIAASDAGEELLDRATPTLQEMDARSLRQWIDDYTMLTALSVPPCPQMPGRRTSIIGSMLGMRSCPAARSARTAARSGPSQMPGRRGRDAGTGGARASLRAIRTVVRRCR